MDHIGGFLEVGVNEAGEVIVNHPPATARGGHLAFSPSQARALAGSLLRFADVAERKTGGPEAAETENLLCLARMVWGMVSDVQAQCQLGGAAAAYGIRPISFSGGEVELIVATKQAAAFFEQAARSRFNVLDTAPVSGEVH